MFLKETTFFKLQKNLQNKMVSLLDLDN